MQPALLKFTNDILTGMDKKQKAPLLQIDFGEVFYSTIQAASQTTGSGVLQIVSYMDMLVPLWPLAVCFL